MDKFSFDKLTPERKQAVPYIEGRPDLFETKILRIKPNNDGVIEESVLVVTRDPGSANALLPVVKELAKNLDLQIDFITDGRAQEIVQANFSTENVNAEEIVLGADKIIGNPNVILMDRSSEMGIDTYVEANFPEVPKILVEDTYGNSLYFLSEIIKRNLPLPEKICVLNQTAKEIIVKEFPQLEPRIEVTGQPSFDKFATENTEVLAEEVKKKLHLKTTDKLVSFMSVGDELEKIRLLAEALKTVPDNFYFVFRRHPRDGVAYEVYQQIFIDAGIKIIDTNDINIDEIGAASDVVLTTWSTEGLSGIYRRKPTVYITDNNFRVHDNIESLLTPVKEGAGVGITKLAEISQILPQLLNPDSILNQELKQKMVEKYPLDGKNTERVLSVVKQYLKSV